MVTDAHMAQMRSGRSRWLRAARRNRAHGMRETVRWNVAKAHEFHDAILKASRERSAAAAPRCAVCGGPDADGNGCEYCPAVHS